MKSDMIKLFAAGAAVFIVVAGALVIWAGVAVFNYAGQMINSSAIPQTLSAAQISAPAIPTVLLDKCWQQSKSMMNVETWLKTPLQDNFSSLKGACLDSSDATKNCNSANCEGGAT